MKSFMKTLIRPSKIFDSSSSSMEVEKSSAIANSNGFSDCDAESRKKVALTNFLKIYFDFAYYSLCSPFHFGWNPNTGSLSLKTWKPQQVVCGLLHVVGIFRLITELRLSIPEVVSQSPVQYFRILANGFKIVFKAVTIKRLWWNRKEFAYIVNFLRQEKSLPDGPLRLQNRYVVSLICGIYTITSLSIVLGRNIIASPSSWEKSWWNRSLVSDGKYAFYAINRSDFNKIPEANDISTVDYMLAAVLGIGLIERFIMGFYFDLCLLFAVLTLWSASHAFARNLKVSFNDAVWTDLSSATQSSVSILEKPSEKWMELYQSYKGIRMLSHLINNAYGSMTTTFIAESILYHSMNMDAILLTQDVFTQAQLLFFIFSSSSTFIFSADICSQMDTLKMWLSKDENRRFVPLDELNIVLHELHTNVIGIRGSNIFTITYSLVWNVLTTVVTYFIICVQSRLST